MECRLRVVQRMYAGKLITTQKSCVLNISKNLSAVVICINHIKSTRCKYQHFRYMSVILRSNNFKGFTKLAAGGHGREEGKWETGNARKNLMWIIVGEDHLKWKLQNTYENANECENLGLNCNWSFKQVKEGGSEFMANGFRENLYRVQMITIPSGKFPSNFLERNQLQITSKSYLRLKLQAPGLSPNHSQEMRIQARKYSPGTLGIHNSIHFCLFPPELK